MKTKKKYKNTGDLKGDGKALKLAIVTSGLPFEVVKEKMNKGKTAIYSYYNQEILPEEIKILAAKALNKKVQDIFEQKSIAPKIDEVPPQPPENPAADDPKGKKPLVEFHLPNKFTPKQLEDFINRNLTAIKDVIKAEIKEDLWRELGLQKSSPSKG